MKRILSTSILLFILIPFAFTQVGINGTGAAPHSSAALDIDFTNLGFLLPRMTTAQRDAIPGPVPGLKIYNLDTDCENYFSNATQQWMELCGTCPPPVLPDAGVHVADETQIEWNWSASAGATGYKWNTSNNYATASDLGNQTSYTQTGLSALTSYTIYVWAYSLCGPTATALELSETTAAPACLVGAIGPGGGRIFYCGNAYPGFIGLEAASSDVSSGAPWGCSGSPITGADGSSTGSGEQNTSEIVSGCGTSGIAAKLCSDLVSGGFDDWFLPSKDELNLMYTELHLQGLGGFEALRYWSSTEANNNEAWMRHFDGGTSDAYTKSDNWRVRAIRKF